MGSRRKGRILAFQALYAWDMADKKEKSAMLDSLLDFSWLEDEKREGLGDSADFSRLLVRGTVEKLPELDGMIRKHLTNWDFSRLNRVDRALLRMSVYTLMYQTEVPPSVVIDEAVDISRDFGTDDSYRFINGVLDSVRKTIQGAKS